MLELIVSDSKVNGHEVCEALIGPKLPGTLETSLELCALGFHGSATDRHALLIELRIVDMFLVSAKVP